MDVLQVEGLEKSYENFRLDRVSFRVREGTVMGFIGRNGAGKTTTLKALLGQVHPDGGSVRFFGREFREFETDIKKQTGFVSGGIEFYPGKTLRTLTGVTRGFYSNWDEEAYRRYLRLFQLDESRKARELSQGMKVKYLLALALSHRARLLILDEPTSGLDPVSRDELLDVFLHLVEREGATVLFSTHITSDLEKCADDITYIREGAVAASTGLEALTGAYRRVAGAADALSPAQRAVLLGYREHGGRFQAVARREQAGILERTAGIGVDPAALEDIMVHLEREHREGEGCDAAAAG